MLIVTAPLWFKAPFKILRLFVREKLRERVFTVSVPQLALHVSRTALPIHLGGTLEIKHATWLLSCRQSMTNREDELANIVGVGVGSESGSAVAAVANGTSETTAAATATAGSTIISAVHQLGENNTTVVTVVSNGDDPAVSGGGGGSEPNENITINGLSPSHQRQANGSSSSSSASTAVNPLKLNTSGLAESGSCSTTNAAATATAGGGAATGAGTVPTAGGGTTTNGSNGEFWSENPPSSASSGFSDDDSLAGQEGDPKPIEQIVQMVKQRGRTGLIKEYADIRNRAPEGTFLYAR